jgi:2-amino-4-hydroxy-6-hydroxymethyldihydropteridine diphosphokinase
MERMNKIIAYIGFGSNLGDRTATWEKTLALLNQTADVHILRAATPIETDPIGPIQDQPRYLNSVIAMETSLAPLDLLDGLLHIEQQLGRVRKERWGPRTVDLDILLYGDETLNHPRLQIPHPEIQNRPFLASLLKEVGYQDVIASGEKQSINGNVGQIASSQSSSQ